MAPKRKHQDDNALSQALKSLQSALRSASAASTEHSDLRQQKVLLVGETITLLARKFEFPGCDKGRLAAGTWGWGDAAAAGRVTVPSEATGEHSPISAELMRDHTAGTETSHCRRMERWS